MSERHHTAELPTEALRLRFKELTDIVEIPRQNERLEVIQVELARIGFELSCREREVETVAL